MENLEYIVEGKCAWLALAFAQRLTEELTYKDVRGFESFKRVGCYDCDGYKKDCPSYMPYKNKEEQLELDFSDDSNFVRGYN